MIQRTARPHHSSTSTSTHTTTSAAVLNPVPLKIYRSVKWHNPQNHTWFPPEHAARQKSRSTLPGIYTCKKASNPPTIQYKWFVDPIDRNKECSSLNMNSESVEEFETLAMERGPRFGK